MSMRSTSARARLTPGSLSGGLLLAVFVLIPYAVALATGQPDANLSGLARLHSAAESVYCAEGLTPVSILLMAECGLLLLALIGAQAAGPRLGQVGALLRQDGWLVLTVLLLIAAPFVIGWRTESSVCERGKAFFWESVFIDAFILAILAISYNLMFGFTGVVSFGHAAYFGTGAYAVGMLMRHLGWPWWQAILATLLIGVGIALVKGFVGVRIKGLYFAMFTLAFAQVFYLLSGNRLMVNLTGAEDGFTFDVPDWLNTAQNRIFFYYMALLILVLSYWLVRRLMNSPTGRVIAALRDNEDRAQMLGYNTFSFKLIAIVVAGVMATGAGVLRGISAKGASPNLLSVAFTIDPLLMTIIGGAGTYLGPALGAFGLHFVEHLLRDTVVTVGALHINIGNSWALILGVLFIVTVLVFPQGIVGTALAGRFNRREGWRRLLGIRLKRPTEPGQSS